MPHCNRGLHPRLQKYRSSGAYMVFNFESVDLFKNSFADGNELTCNRVEGMNYLDRVRNRFEGMNYFIARL